MKTFFTSDTHFGHGNIIKYCNRPFKDSAEMGRVIIENWNKVVSPNDMIFHLGDFCFGREEWEFDLWFEQLNGTIFFVEGNHDKLARKNKHKFFSYKNLHEIEVNGQDIVLCHYAMKVWNRSHRGAWHLYGHSHGSLPDDPNSLSIDVGVDVHGFRPISFEEVSTYMAKKNYIPLDHHKPRSPDGAGFGLNKLEYEKLERKRQYEMLKKEFGNV